MLTAYGDTSIEVTAGLAAKSTQLDTIVTFPEQTRGSGSMVRFGEKVQKRESESAEAAGAWSVPGRSAALFPGQRHL